MQEPSNCWKVSESKADFIGVLEIKQRRLDIERACRVRETETAHWHSTGEIENEKAVQ